MSSPQNPEPNIDEVLCIAHNAYAGLPDNLLDAACDVVILVEEFPAKDILVDLELDSPYDLLGLYDGVSMLDKSVLDTPKWCPISWISTWRIRCAKLSSLSRQ